MNTRLTGRAAAAAAVVLGVAAIGGTALAGHIGSDVKSYTGCLGPNDGSISKVAPGDAPKSPCNAGQTQVHLSGGDITSVDVQAGGGLTGGGANGAVSLSLRRDCSSDQIVKWDGSAWTCAADSNSTYSAGSGLDLSSAGEFSVEPDYRLPQTCASGEAAIRNPAVGGSAATWACGQFATASQSCANGKFAEGITAVGVLSCASPPSAGTVKAYSATVGSVVLAGQTTVISKVVPAGTYLLSASVELVNKDGDSVSTGYCEMPGYTSANHPLDERVIGGLGTTAESISMTSAVAHPGGAVVLSCTELVANVDVETATLNALRVDTLG